MVKFSDLNIPGKPRRSADPEEIYKQLPKRNANINDLWRGQTDVLRAWNTKARTHENVLVSLNTGAGKTLVGLLIAQSLTVELGGYVLYLCATRDLVNQTAREAHSLGFQFSTRTAANFSDTLYETGNGFCITTYQAALQPYTVFKNELTPRAIVFDDAHVAETIIRDLLTFTISKASHPLAFSEFTRLITPAFQAVDKHEAYREMLAGTVSHQMLVPPDFFFNKSPEISELIKSHKLDREDTLKYRWGHLRDKVGYCACIVSSERVEISPPFLPSKAIYPLADRNIRKVFLSATLTGQAEFSRAFGRQCTVVSSEGNDAGQGERLIITGDAFTAFSIPSSIVDAIIEDHKFLIAVPSYREAQKWASYGKPPNSETFSEALDEFRAAKKGVFVLVQRVDGIDLPKDTCRVMLIDGLPTSEALIERFQYKSLGMNIFHNSRLATRVTQLFGRINRGRNDYGVFFINGKDLNVWLTRKQNAFHLPELLRKQLLLGKSATELLKKEVHGSPEKAPLAVLDMIATVFDRSEASDWQRQYSAFVNSEAIDEEVKEVVEDREDAYVQSALSEVAFMSAIWRDEVVEAIDFLKEIPELVSAVDEKLAGWLQTWLGIAYLKLGEHELADVAFRRAKGRLAAIRFVATSQRRPGEVESGSLGAVESSLKRLLEMKSDRGFEGELTRCEHALAIASSHEATFGAQEEAVRVLGEFLGFDAERPDNQGDGGPDVLWIDRTASILYPLECKLDKYKTPSSLYTINEIGNCKQYLERLQDRFQAFRVAGIVIVGPDRAVSSFAGRGENLYLITREELVAQFDRLFAGLRVLRRTKPVNIGEEIATLTARCAFGTDTLWSALTKRSIADQPREKRS